MSRTRRARTAALAAVAALVALPAIGAETITFPELSGRVVDGAGLIPRDQERRLTEQLAAHEDATTNQVVVVTLESLEGRTIEQYGYQLGRYWGIGQKGRDNGALLIVAPAERRVRIEVGYGLEGTLTDAISSNIVHAIVLPAFKRGDMAGGIEAGALAIVEALGGEYRMRDPRPTGRSRPTSVLPFILLVIVVGILNLMSPGGLRRPYRRGVYMGPTFGGGRGGFGGGGFGGGGGGFGGGGASGGW